VALLFPALVIIEAGWLVWFYREPLPNAANVGGVVPRWIFLARALPQVVPGVTFEQSYFGMALEELSHVGYLPQRLPIVAAAALIAAAALGLGRLILHGLRIHSLLSTAERIALSFGLGASGLGVLTLLAGRLGLLAPWRVRIGLAIFAAVELGLLVREIIRRGRISKHPSAAEIDPPIEGTGATGFARVAFLALAGPFLMLMALGAMLPTVDFDAIEYHLQGPKEFFQAGRISFLPHNVYTSMPFSVEMLHLLGMEVVDDWWSGALAGQLLIALFAPAAAVLIAMTARRAGAPRAGWFAAVVYLTTPWVYRLGVLPYVEGPLAYYHAALVWAALRAWQELAGPLWVRLWGLAGLLAGGAMACKYPALISAVIPFGLVALADAVRRRSPAVLVTFTLGWAAVMTPWLAKNVIDTGNPVYPLAYNVFGGSHWDAALDEKWSNGHGRRPVSAGLLWTSVVDVAGRSDWQSPLYVALAPLALVRRGSRRLAVVLWAFVAYLFLTWWLLTHRLDRFWLPLLPSLAVLAGLGADWTRSLAWSVLVAILLTLALVSNLSYCSTALTGLNEWTEDLSVLRKKVPEMLNPPLARLDNSLPHGAKVLLVGQAAVFHVNHPIVYNTVFNNETFETLARGKTPAEARAELKRRGIAYIYVDWFEIDRYRSPGNYGFTDFVTPDVFERLVNAGVLERGERMGARQELFKVSVSDR
jgi:hypothetical protein